MKKVRFIASIASEEFNHKPGDVATLPANVAAAWIAHGLCEAIEEPAPEKKK